MRKEISIDGIIYEGYKVGELPSKFGFIQDAYFGESEGITDWFKGVGKNEGLIFIANYKKKVKFSHKKMVAIISKTL